jgi:hypothetical protein
MTFPKVPHRPPNVRHLRQIHPALPGAKHFALRRLMKAHHQLEYRVIHKIYFLMKGDRSYTCRIGVDSLTRTPRTFPHQDSSYGSAGRAKHSNHAPFQLGPFFVIEIPTPPIISKAPSEATIATIAFKASFDVPFGFFNLLCR